MHTRPCCLIAYVIALFLVTLTNISRAVTPVPFTPNNPLSGGPVGWTFAGNKFVGTILGDGTGKMYSTDLTGNNVQSFGGTVNLLNGHGQEHYVASSFGLGGFAAGDIWVASDNNVQHITNAGVPDPGLFINPGSSGPNIVGLVRGITFDTTGGFGNQMIIDTDAGNIYTVNSSGFPTLIASTGEDTEGLDIAPLNGTWGTMAGWLFVASEGSGKIRAIKPGAFTMLTVATVFSAEQIDFVPMTLGTNPLEGLYSANFGVNVLHTTAPQFNGMQGDLIVTGELSQQLTDLTPTLQQSVIGSYPNQPEDGLFVTSDILALDGTVPEPSTLALVALVTPVLLARRTRRSASRC